MTFALGMVVGVVATLVLLHAWEGRQAARMLTPEDWEAVARQLASQARGWMVNEPGRGEHQLRRAHRYRRIAAMQRKRMATKDDATTGHPYRGGA